MRKPWEYEDIVALPHHVSADRPHLSMTERAAQFSPFAALTGYEAAIHAAVCKKQEEIEARNAGVSDEALFG